MQSLSGKLAALKRFLSRSAEKSLPFFETLKDITKENKDEYCWTKSEEKAFQEMKTLNEAEINYAPMKKLALALLHMSWRLRRYFEAHPIKGSGTGLVLISPSGVEFMYALWLNFTSTNNEAEYEALLAGLRMAKKMNVQDTDAKVDSKLVASQINGSCVASSTSMVKYLVTTKECIAGFRSFVIQNIPKNLNQKADILSKLATHAFDHLTKKVLVEVLAERSTDRKEVSAIVEEEEDN
ncbi:reverse transcriptase domain-containing protein [Tanacetum coccineum]